MAIAVINLPSAADLCDGKRAAFEGYVYVVDGVRFVAQAGEVIYVGSRCSPTGGHIESTQFGDAIRLAAINDTTFVGMAELPSGAWAVLPAAFGRGFDRGFE